MEKCPYSFTTDYAAMFVLVMQDKRLAAFATEQINNREIVRICEVKKNIFPDSIEFFTVGYFFDQATEWDGRTMEEDFYRCCNSLKIQFIRPAEQ